MEHINKGSLALLLIEKPQTTKTSTQPSEISRQIGELLKKESAIFARTEPKGKYKCASN